MAKLWINSGSPAMKQERSSRKILRLAGGIFATTILLIGLFALRGRDDPQESPGHGKLGFCHLGGWPDELILVHEETPVSILVAEAENIDEENKLHVLIAAVTHDADHGQAVDRTSATEILERVLPKLKCDFREGGVAKNSRRWPIHRSSVAMSVLAENDHLRGVSAKLSCDLPLPGVGDYKIPKHGDKDTIFGLHWQLYLEPGNDGWLSAPSFPLCKAHKKKEVGGFPDIDVGLNADDYRSRGEDSKAEQEDSIWPALCIMPSTKAHPSWSNSSILDWIFYQQRVVGFSDIFYLDSNGEGTWLSHPEAFLSFVGMDLVHVPHAAVHRSLSALIRMDGAVAEALARERCLMLARQRSIDYVMVARDPMDLVVPMHRRKYALPEALSNAVGGQGGCSKRVHLVKALVSFSSSSDSEPTTFCHDEDWCSLPDGHDVISQFLIASKPFDIQDEPDESDDAVVWRAALHPSILGGPCNESTAIGQSDLVLMSREKGSHDDDSRHVETHGSLEQIFPEVAKWVRLLVEANRDASVRAITHRSQAQSEKFMPVPNLLEETASPSMAMGLCTSDHGPLYGKAILRKYRHANPDAPDRSEAQLPVPIEDELHLTFYNAEVTRAEEAKQFQLTISVLAEDRDSRDFSLYHEWAWGRLFQTNQLPEVDCVYFHPDPVQHFFSGELRTPAKWRHYENLLLWLECPLPQELPLPDKDGHSSLVTVEQAATVAQDRDNASSLRTIRAFALCTGKKVGTDHPHCDEKSMACRVGCIDDEKSEVDPQAKCCFRCQERHQRYTRFDERDFWTQTSASARSLKTNFTGRSSSEASTSLVDPSAAQRRAFLQGRDLSICLRPFFLESTCVECDGIDALSPQRLVEWIEYHLLIGFDVLYILDRYGTELVPLLQRYIESGRVVHVPFPFMSDTPLSPEARSDRSKIVPAGHDQVLAYDLCLSLARRRDDAFTAFIDSDEFVRYPMARAGQLRAVLGSLLSDHWNSPTLPDSIVLDRFDVEVQPEGLVLGYRNRTFQAKTHQEGKRRHGKVLVRPQAMVHGCVHVHNAYNASGSSKRFRDRFVDGSNALVAPLDRLAIYHYREKDTRTWVANPSTYEGRLVEDVSLKWAYDIISSQFVASMGWKAAYGMSRQGTLRLGKTKVLHSLDGNPHPSLFIGILTYCANRDRRDAIRETWLSGRVLEQVSQLLRVEVRFILGQAPTSEHSKWCGARVLRQEVTDFGDLLFLEQTAESYQVLSRKSIGLIKWAGENRDPDFVFKTDDDSYVDLVALAEALIQVESPNIPLYFGQVKHKHISFSTYLDATPEGRWYTKPEHLPIDTQMYAIGAGYILSRPLVQRISNMVADSNFQVPWGPENEIGWLEDAAVGYVLRGAVNRAGRAVAMDVHDLWFPFHCKGDHDLAVIHHLEAAQQHEAHRIFTTSSTLDVCQQLDQTFPTIRMPKASDEKRKDATKWTGSFLDRPLSPLLTESAPPFQPPREYGDAANSNPAPYGRDVIVVTGGCHNIGRSLVETIQQGYSRMPGPITVLVIDSAASTVGEGSDEPCIFSRTPSTSSHMDVSVKLIAVDIQHYDDLYTSLMPFRSRIRGVIHLAAISQVQECQSNVTACRQVNVGGTKNILRALWSLYRVDFATEMHNSTVQPILPWLLFASSREVYGALNLDDVADETSPLHPLNVYGETKLAAEHALQQWTRKTKFNAITLRFTNVYGSCHDHPSRLVPHWISSLINGDKVQVYGSMEKTISLLHVQDAVQAILLALRFATVLDNTGGFYEVFNIGGGPTHDALNIMDLLSIAKSSLVGLVKNCSGCVEAPIFRNFANDSSHAPEPEHFRSSIEKAFRVLGYHPSRTYNSTTLENYIQTCGLVDNSAMKDPTERVTAVEPPFDMKFFEMVQRLFSCAVLIIVYFRKNIKIMRMMK